MTTLNDQLAPALVSYMTDAGITRAAIAKHLGRSASYVGERLDGTRPVSLDIAGAVATLAHIAPATLLTELSERMRGAAH